jgi:hypothetical protein
MIRASNGSVLVLQSTGPALLPVMDMSLLMITPDHFRTPMPLCSIDLPAQGPGLCHIALLEGPRPDTTASSSSSSFAKPCSKDSLLASSVAAASTTAAAGPLLLLPLLVLPEEAAVEMQQAWQATALTATPDSVCAAPAGHEDFDLAVQPAAAAAAAAAAEASDDNVAVAWSGIVASLTVDMAYVLSACSTVSALAATAAAGDNSSSSSALQHNNTLPAGVSAVLCNLLQHLAACGMFYTMKFLVETATAATAASNAPISSKGSAGSRSSSSSSSSSNDESGGDCSNADPANTTAAPAGANAAGNFSRASSTAAPAAGIDGTGNGSSSSSSANSCCEVTASLASDVVTCSRTFGTWDSSKSCNNTNADACLGSVKPAAAENSTINSRSDCSSCHEDAAPATLLQLLCGFADPGLERRFLAATFSSSATLDLFTAVYSIAMGVGCWFAAGAKHCTPPLAGMLQQQQQQQQPLNAGRGQTAVAAVPAFSAGDCSWDAGVGSSSIVNFTMVWSVAAVLVLYAGTSLAVWLLRLQVAKAVKQHSQQQPSERYSSSSTSKAQSGTRRACVQGDGAVTTAIAALHSQSGCTRQRLLALWVVQAAVLDVLCACGAVITPGMMVRAWGLGGWAQNAACVLGLAVKAWMYQVPFHWFVPLMAVELATHVYGSIAFGFQLGYWLAVRYTAALLAALVVCAAHNVLARKQFWASQRSRVQGAMASRHGAACGGR